jgi:hypothetical protein
MLTIKNITADGPTSEVIRLRGSATLDLDGVFDGAEGQLEISFNNGATWKAVPDGLMNETNSFTNILTGICFLRINISSAGANTDLTLSAYIFGH